MSSCSKSSSLSQEKNNLAVERVSKMMQKQDRFGPPSSCSSSRNASLASRRSSISAGRSSYSSASECPENNRRAKLLEKRQSIKKQRAQKKQNAMTSAGLNDFNKSAVGAKKPEKDRRRDAAQSQDLDFGGSGSGSDKQS